MYINKIRVIILYFFHLVDMLLEVSFLGSIYVREKAFIKRRNAKWYKICGLKNNCEKDVNIINLQKEECTTIFEPSYFELSQQKEYIYNCPYIYIAKLYNVVCIGGSDLILKGNVLLFDEYDRNDTDRVYFKSGPIKKIRKNNYFMVETSNDIIEVEKAINLCGFASTNYYHFTIEILSRIGYVDKYPEYDDYTILIDERSQNYLQMREMLETFCTNRNVQLISEGQKVLVHHLVQPSKNTWLPLNLKKRNDARISDNLIAKSALDNIRSKVKPYFCEQGNEKIYLSRKNTNQRRIVNEDQVIDLFKKAGFTIVYTENLNYFEQIKLFSSAKCIVGPTGAALTNLVYCHSGTVVGCLIPKEYNFCIYSSIAHMLGCKCLFLDAKIVFRHFYIAGDKYRINIGQCKKYIEKLIQLC